MPAFADIETRINQAVQSRMTNATADFGNGLEVDVIFESGFVESMGMVSGNQVTIECMASLVPGVKRGSFVAVRGVEYTIGEMRPDETGWLVMVLEK